MVWIRRCPEQSSKACSARSSVTNKLRLRFVSDRGERWRTVARAKKTTSKKTKATTKKRTTSRRTTSTGKKTSSASVRKGLPPKAAQAARKAADALWDVGVPPHQLLQEVHELLLLRCLESAEGNYAAAAARFGPSRQSVQQYANSPLRDARWKPYQQNKRKTRSA